MYIRPRTLTQVYFMPVAMVDTLRELTSGKRRRFRQSGFNLDLSFITPRLIAMGLPSDGFESLYRNSRQDVSEMLNMYFGSGGYLVVNVSEREYDGVSVFKGGSYWHAGWPDHHAPPLAQLWELAGRVNAWLAERASRVVVVHCKAVSTMDVRTS